MHSTIYIALIIGFAIGLSALVPLTLFLKPRWKARGYAIGFRAGDADAQVEMAERSAALNADLVHHRNLRELDRLEYQQKAEAIMLDADERIAVYSRRANPFSTIELNALAAMANNLELSASTFAGLLAGDKARYSRQLAGLAAGMHDRLKLALAGEALPHPDTVLIDWLDEHATFWGDHESGELRFPLITPEEGAPHVRNLLQLAVQQHQQTESLEHAA